MSDITIGLLSFPALLILIFLRVPIGLAMLLGGLVGLTIVSGDTTLAFARLKSETFTTFSSYSLSIIPMFLLMGHFATLGGMMPSVVQSRRKLSGTPQRRGCDGGGWGLCGLWCDLWVIACDRSYDEPRRFARAAPLRLFGWIFDSDSWLRAERLAS